MKMPHIFLIVLTGILLINLTSALEITHEFDSNVIIRDFNNPIELTVKITNTTPGNYNFFTLADIYLTPGEIFQLNKEDVEKIINITPTENLDVEGLYTFTYTLNHRDVERIDKKLTINLVNLEDIIKISSNSINPESEIIGFYVENKENVIIPEMEVKFSSVLFNIEETLNLGPKERAYFPVNVEKSKLEETKAGVYIIRGIFQTEFGEKIIEGNLYLGEKKGVSSEEIKKGILIKTQILTKTNVGNIVETVQISAKRNFISRLFTNFDIEPTSTNRNGAIIEYSWVKENLGPAEVFEIKITTNYIFPFLAIVLTILTITGFRRLTQTKLEIKKSANHVKTKSGEFALKISISVRAKRDVKNLSLIDRIPAIVKIYNKFGTTKPDKIDPESRRLRWNVGDLDSGEERIFSYIVYSKIGVMGKFSLPESKAVFESDGKIQETHSNIVHFMSDQVKR
jgi:hypothetical protein